MKMHFTQKTSEKVDALVIPVMEDSLSTAATNLDQEMKGAVKKALETEAFSGKSGEIYVISHYPEVGADHIVILGLGKAEDACKIAIEKAGAKLQAKLNGAKLATADIFIEDLGEIDAATVAEHLAIGAKLGAYQYDDYKTGDKKKEQSLTDLTFVLDAADQASVQFDVSDKVCDGALWTRDLVTMPGNELYPESFANMAKAELEPLGVKVQILSMAEMEEKGMGAIISVGKGSVREPKMVIMEYRGADDASEQPVAFVGKGVTFDTGGISLKPGAGMWDMKFDMGGAGVVVGLMKALAGRKAKANVVAGIGLAENMPSGCATRPGDVVTSMSGQSIEVLNTDAEGRLVLADTLWQIQESFKPKMIIDLATLTGAMIVALGHEFGGIYTNDDDLAGKIIAAGKEVDEAAWHMPLCDIWDKAIDSPIADMKNITAPSVGAGSATAASFLRRFIQDDVSWAHLDIAGVAWREAGLPVTPKGATSWGVRLLDQLVATHYEA